MPEVHDAFPNLDDGGGSLRGRMLYTNRDQIPLGCDPGSSVMADRLMVDFPDWIYWGRKYLGVARVKHMNGSRS